MLPNELSGAPWTPRGEGEAWGCVGSAFGHVVVTRYSWEKGVLGAVRGFVGEPGAWVQNDLRPAMCPVPYVYGRGVHSLMPRCLPPPPANTSCSRALKIKNSSCSALPQHLFRVRVHLEVQVALHVRCITVTIS